ncbi:Metal-dependent hydrolase, endonuclease/exonuclease/phosphatase family [Streptomyces sp. 2231.1]|uniref:endonuclease/exonuclease/phosphatase family protein n=1 Tax=Streptomyces sp. 2231.1 TaxID=1855347 RepID=UPI00089A6137|nr:endonuclease/exonuclease/phosphatase family protein [Streptomyces sp. 2231.1]SED92051.1 Metal-dependent hydrolase, endonuclease/exonuclease/phosphatase family [Streptomyces sp. 2231.1]
MFRTSSASAAGSGGSRWRGPVAVAAALLGLVTAVASAQLSGPARSAAPRRTLTVATWNMCGVEQWNCRSTGSPTAKRNALEAMASRSGARVFFLQEVCAGDLDRVRADLGASWHTEFRPYTWRGVTGRTTTVRCAGAGQGAAGVALLSAYRLSAVEPVESRQPAVGLRRGILCATVADQGVRVCTAHLSRPGDDRAHPDWELRDDQLKALAAAVPGRTVYGGDLNADPPGPRDPDSWIWPAGPYRAQRECDQASASSRSGRPTHVSGHKIDYLFSDLPRLDCSVRGTGASDHYALLLRIRTR